MLKKILVIIVSIIFLSGCSIIKTVVVLKSGKVDPGFTHDEIPFNNKAGLIIIKATIKGNQYNFIFDTGAPCAISSELAHELGLTPDFFVNSIDAKGNKEKAGFVEVEEIHIGDAKFMNIGAAIIDFKAIREIGCLAVDGIIGANLMRKIKWKINYKEKRLILSKDLGNLCDTESTPFIEFSPLITGTPIIDISISPDLHFSNVKFDTGSNGGLNLSLSDYNEFTKKVKNQKIIKGYGIGSSGMYGTSCDTSYFVSCDTVKSGNWTFYNPIVEFSHVDGNIIGNAVFENYSITLDWDEKKIYFEETEKPKPATLETHGFTVKMIDNKLVAGFIYENSPASAAGMKVGDQIISINHINYEDVSISDYCKIITNQVAWKNAQSIEVKWKDANDLKTSEIIRTSLF